MTVTQPLSLPASGFVNFIKLTGQLFTDRHTHLANTGRTLRPPLVAEMRDETNTRRKLRAARWANCGVAYVGPDVTSNLVLRPDMAVEGTLRVEHIFGLRTCASTQCTYKRISGGTLLWLEHSVMNRMHIEEGSNSFRPLGMEDNVFPSSSTLTHTIARTRARHGERPSMRVVHTHMYVT